MSDPIAVLNSLAKAESSMSRFYQSAERAATMQLVAIVALFSAALCVFVGIEIYYRYTYLARNARSVPPQADKKENT